MSTPVSKEVPLVELEEVTCRAGNATILGPLSLRVGSEECVGVIGPNGAGKSTLLGLMNATVRPSSGWIRILGSDPWRLSESGRCGLRVRVAAVLQRNEYSTMAPISARDVVAMGRLGARGLLGGIPASDAKDIDAALERFGLAGLAARTYRSLSGGEQQKAQIARALLQHPRCLLLDEPTSGLDIDWQERLVDLVETLALSRGLAIVMATHAIHHLPRTCRRAVLLRKGSILFDGDTESALTPEHIGALYGCSVEIIERHGRRYCMPSNGGEAAS